MLKRITDCKKAVFHDLKWDTYFMDIAKRTAQLSKDPSTKVGAVIENNKMLVSVGYNGFPRRMYDDPQHLFNRKEKYKRIIHAEMNAILNAIDFKSIVGSRMYIYPFPPCINCAKFVMQCGVEEIVIPCDNNKIPKRWLDEMNESVTMMIENGLKVRAIPYEL